MCILWLRKVMGLTVTPVFHIRSVEGLEGSKIRFSGKNFVSQRGEWGATMWQSNFKNVHLDGRHDVAATTAKCDIHFFQNQLKYFVNALNIYVG